MIEGRQMTVDSKIHFIKSLKAKGITNRQIMGIYMDTPEDMEKLRRTKAQNTIEKFCTEHHYTERKQVMKDGKINELIEQIYKETDLSNRKIANLLEIGASTVQRVKTNRSRMSHITNLELLHNDNV